MMQQRGNRRIKKRLDCCQFFPTAQIHSTCWSLTHLTSNEGTNGSGGTATETQLLAHPKVLEHLDQLHLMRSLVEEQVKNS